MNHPFSHKRKTRLPLKTIRNHPILQSQFHKCHSTHCQIPTSKKGSKYRIKNLNQVTSSKTMNMAPLMMTKKRTTHSMNIKKSKAMKVLIFTDESTDELLF